MKLTADAFKQLRFTGVLLLVAIVTAGGWVYWSSIEQQRRYLTSRDFRLLTMLANQTENLIEGNARVFQGALADAPFTRASLEKWRAAAQSTVPMLQDAELVGVPEKADRMKGRSAGSPSCPTPRGRGSGWNSARPTG